MTNISRGTHTLTRDVFHHYLLCANVEVVFHFILRPSFLVYCSNFNREYLITLCIIHFNIIVQAIKELRQGISYVKADYVDKIFTNETKYVVTKGKSSYMCGSAKAF